MRLLLLAALALAAIALLGWSLRPSGEHAPPLIAAGGAPVAPTPAPAAAIESAARETPLVRVEVEDGAARQRAYVKSLPQAGLLVRVQDPHGLLVAPFLLRLEVRLPTSQRARFDRPLDAQLEARFESVPAGTAWLTLLGDASRGEVPWHLTQRPLELAEGEKAEVVMDLGEKVGLVELECENPPAEGFRRLRLKQNGDPLVEWAAPVLRDGVARAWLRLPARLEAVFESEAGRYTEERHFDRPGRIPWRVRLPSGKLELRWSPSTARVRYSLESETGSPLSPEYAGESGDGGVSFPWLRPGRYFARAIVLLADDAEGAMAERIVEIGAGTEAILLPLAAPHELACAWPALPEEAGGASAPYTVLLALRAPGAAWPVHAEKEFTVARPGLLRRIPAGEYDLIASADEWVSRTRVQVPSFRAEPLPLEPWRRLTTLYLTIESASSTVPPARVEWRDSEGQRNPLQQSRLQFLLSGPGGKWRFEGSGASGPATIVVTHADGAVEEFHLEVAALPHAMHLLQLQ